jgi:hypothetical protein
MKLMSIALLGIMLLGCAWYRAQWTRDGRCLPICAAELGDGELRAGPTCLSTRTLCRIT